jgi:septum formation topological specificity factor MinE
MNEKENDKKASHWQLSRLEKLRSDIKSVISKKKYLDEELKEIELEIDSYND